MTHFSISEMELEQRLPQTFSVIREGLERQLGHAAEHLGTLWAPDRKGVER